MFFYGASETVSDRKPSADMQNMLTLRKDIHKSFKEKKFTFVPKCMDGSDSSYFCVHFVRETDDLAPLYHNRIVGGSYLGAIVSTKFLYARYA